MQIAARAIRLALVLALLVGASGCGLVSSGPCAGPDPGATSPSLASGHDPVATWFRSEARPVLVAREYWAQETDQGWQAPNRRQNLRTYFRRDGIEVVDRTATGSPTLVSLALAHVGRGDRRAAVPAGELRSSGNRVELRRPGVVEWFVNGEAGLEQGFTLDEPPFARHGDDRVDPMFLDLQTRGATAELSDGDVRLKTEAGQDLSYGKLFVVDATGRSLAARFEVPEPDVIRIRVDDRDARYPVVIDPILSGNESIIESDQASALLGSSVASAGDVNGDGYDDVIVGAPNFDNAVGTGAAFVFLGSPAGIGAGSPANADAVLTSNQGVPFLNPGFGSSVASAGDVDRDGYGDVIVGGPAFASASGGTGAAFVFHGSATGIASGNQTTARTRIEIAGSDDAGLGSSVASAGDVNGDGYGDVLIGAPIFDATVFNEGAAFVFLGSATGIPSGTHLTANARLGSDQGGFPSGSLMGARVASAGDVNGDGFDDVVVGAPQYNGCGSAFLFLGSSTGTGNGNPANADTVLAASGCAFFDSTQFGNAVAGAGDVDADGYDDLIIGAPGYDLGQTNEGAAFLFRGSATGIPSGAPSTAAATLQLDQAGAGLGSSVATAGDANGDGVSDVVVGAANWSDGESQEGLVAVWYGSPQGLLADSAFPDRTFESSQAGAALGRAVASAGDVDGDGSDDLVFGASVYENGSETDEGVAIVVESGPPSIVESVFGFEGTTIEDDEAVSGIFVIPPDTTGAVGPTEFVELTPGTLSVFDKQTGVLRSRVSAQGFWQAAGIPIASGAYTWYQQHLLYDFNERRWLASGAGGTRDKTNLAVSQTSDPLGAWKAVQLAHVLPTSIAASPTLAVDRDGVYVGTNDFIASSGFFEGATLSVIPKRDLLGTVPTLAHATTLKFPASPLRYSIQGAVNRYASLAKGDLLARAGSQFVSFSIDAVNGPGAIASEPVPVGVVESGFNESARQPSGPRRIDTYDGQSLNNVVRVGGRIYVTHTVTKAALNAPPSLKYTSVQWQVFAAATGSLIDAGLISGSGFDYYQSAIAVNELGQAVILFNRSGGQTTDKNGDGKADGRISLMAQAFSGEASGGLDPVGAPILLRVSEVDEYAAGFLSTTPWGSTSAVTVDPTDPHAFFAVGTYAATTTNSFGSWHTYIAAIRLVPEPDPVAALLVGLLGIHVGHWRRRARTGIGHRRTDPCPAAET